MGAERSGPLAQAQPSQPQRSVACFPDPLREDPALEAFLSSASTRLCQWWSSAAERSPLPLLSVLPEPAPLQQGLSAEALLEDLQLVMDGAYNPVHPGAMAHLDPPPLTASVAADLVCAGLNNNLLAEELSPSLSRLERSLTHCLSAFTSPPHTARASNGLAPVLRQKRVIAHSSLPKPTSMASSSSGVTTRSRPGFSLGRIMVICRRVPMGSFSRSQ